MPNLYYTRAKTREHWSDFFAREIPARVKRIRDLTEQKKTWAEIARAEEVSVPAIWNFCEKHDPDVMRLITRNGMTRSTKCNKCPEEIVFVLKLLAGADAGKWTQRKVAQMVGVSPAAVCLWRKRYAPFGVGEALDLYMENEEDVDWFYQQLEEFVAIPALPRFELPRNKRRENVQPAYEKRRQRDAALNGPTSRFRNESETDVSAKTNLKLTFCPR